MVVDQSIQAIGKTAPFRGLDEIAFTKGCKEARSRHDVARILQRRSKASQSTAEYVKDRPIARYQGNNS